MKYNPSSFLFQTVTVFWLLRSLFWMIPRRLNFICLRIGTLCSILKGGVLTSAMKLEQTECCETSAHKIQTVGNNKKKRIQRTTFVLCSSTVYLKKKDAVVVE
jgi:hypothetical protein